MKKFIRYFAIASCLLLGICLIIWIVTYGVTKDPRRESSTSETRQASEKRQQQIEVKLIFDRENKLSSSFVQWREETTAYDMLTMLAEENNIEIETEQYDFGIFVKSIGGFESSNEKAWIYFVNGESGQVSADKQIVKPGDLVEWKYIEPKF